MMAFRTIFSLMLLLFLWQAISESQFWQDILKKYKNNKKIFLVLISLIFLAILSTVFSKDILFSLWSSPHRSGGSINFIFSVLLSLVLFLTVRDKDWNKLWTFSFIVADVVVAFAAIQYFDILPKIFVDYTYRPPSTMSNPILLAIYLLLLIFPLLALAIKEKSKKAMFYWISLALFLFGIFVSGSRAAYLGIFIGVIYFILFFPKKLFKTKIIISAALLLIFSAVLYINFALSHPDFIEKSGKISVITKRLSIENAIRDLGETRFSAWKVFFNSSGENPFLGWGPENQSIAFDKYYDPSLPYLVGSSVNNWWDRAHNIFLDLAISYGYIFLAIYIFIFGFLFWKQQKAKKESGGNKINCHAIQSTFLSYFIVLMFGFDSVSTYIILFFIIGYSMFLVSENNATEPGNALPPKFYESLYKKRKVIILFAGLFCVWFLWQFALKPISINAKINRYTAASCRQKLEGMEKLLPKKSFLDAFLRLKYLEEIKSCDKYISSDEDNYIKKAIESLKYALLKRPNYTRSWILLADFNNVLLAKETNPEVIKSTLTQSEEYLKMAQKLSPRRPEILVSLAGAYFAYGDYKKMEESSTACVKTNPTLNSCYWYLGLSEILLGKTEQGKKDIETAKNMDYEWETQPRLSQLALAYTKTGNIKEIAPIYENLLKIDPDNVQFKATLAFVYKELGEYKKAKEMALEILKSSPEMKDEVDEFLKTLPR